MTSPITHTIIIAYDNPEALEFATWLADNDHDVSIGISTGNYVDGTHTSSSEAANDIMRNLWDHYCNQI